jgi:hypothetical protein
MSQAPLWSAETCFRFLLSPALRQAFLWSGCPHSGRMARHRFPRCNASSRAPERRTASPHAAPLVLLRGRREKRKQASALQRGLPLIPLLLVAFPPAFAAETGQPRPSPLAAVKALDKPVTLSETKISLGELVQKVAAETGAPLTATREVADEPVAVVVSDLPARELLEQVADLLDYRWSQRGKDGEERYEIWQDLAAKQREAALREARLREVVARFRKVLARHAALASLPPEVFHRRLTAAAERARVRGPRVHPDTLPLTPEQREAAWNDEAVRMLQSPVQRTLALLLARMPAAQWDQLVARGRLVLSTQPGPGEQPFPDEIARRLRDAGPTWRTDGWWLEAPTAEEEEGYRERDRRMHDAWAAAKGYRATLELDMQAFQRHGGLHLEARAATLRGEGAGGLVLTPGADQLPSFVSLPGHSPGAMLFLSATPHGNRDPAEALTPAQRAALERDPVFGAVARFRPEGTTSPEAAGEKPLPEYLPELARRYSVSFLSDSYWLSFNGVSPSAIPPAPTALHDLLERLIGFTHRWDRRGRLVRLRSRTWFLQRPSEVPLRLVRQWKELSARNGALTLDTFAACAAALTDAQMDILGSLREPAGLSPDFSMVPGGRNGLRFYAILSAAQRQALWEHRPVSLTRLTPAQRLLLLAAVREGWQDPEWQGRPEQLAGATLSLKEEPLVRVRRQQGDTITEQEFAPGAPELIALDQARPAAPGSAKRITVTRYPVARVTLTIQLEHDGGWTGPPTLIVSPPGERTTPPANAVPERQTR